MQTATALSRAELAGTVGAYLDAVAARDPARAPLSPRIRFTENSQVLDVGDGFWATCSGRGVYAHVAADPVTQQAGFIGVMRENGVEVIFGLRIKLEDGLITEAETVVSRDPILFYKDGPQKLEAMGRPLPIWTEPVPPAERRPREEMIAAAEAYFQTLERNDGRRTAPLAPECDRMDNGVMATHAPEFDPAGDPPFYALGPADQLATGYFRFVTRIRDRRYPIVDEEYGVVFSLSFLDHSGAVHEVTLTDGRTVPIGVKRPFAWQIMEMFKVTGGLIRQIEVLLNHSFYGMRPGWPAVAGEADAP
ncbi:MAG: hypothetical protein WDM92_04255 [Caulobacteraceae bacterium]